MHAWRSQSSSPKRGSNRESNQDVSAKQEKGHETLSPTVLYSMTEVDNLNAEPADALRRIIYMSANLIWCPDAPLTFGVEFLRGGRQNRDGSNGTDNRIQLQSQFSF